MASGNATVKSVVSGDTLILVGKATSSGPPPEITITLSHVQCPKIARGPSQTHECFAWESREFLRDLCVGKPVSFRVTQTVTSINRTFGEVLLDGVPVVKLVVEHGWAALKEQRDRETTPETDDLLASLITLNAAAKAAQLGMYCSDAALQQASMRAIDWSADAAKYHASLTASASASSNKVGAGQLIVLDAIIEHVRDGASFRVFVPRDRCYVSFALAGATCPRVNTPSTGNSGSSASSASEGATATSSSGGGGPEPFAAQSKVFTELRLLNRRLDLVVRGVSSGRGEPMLLGTVRHPRGDITQQLLKAGLARVADWTLALLPRDDVLAVRAAETSAKQQRRGLWAAISPSAAGAGPHCRVFEGVVVEVLSGDTVMVLEGGGQGEDGGVERRVTLSSVRVPRLQTRGNSSSSSSSASEPFALECRDLLRQKLVGKPVVVSIEYQRGGGSEGGGKDKDVRQFGSVFYGAGRQAQASRGRGQDVALQLVQEGLATPVKHRGDEPRAAGYDMLLLEEVAAQQRGLGVHGPASQALSAPVNDVTSDPKKAKAFFATLSKDKTYRGVIEHCFTGSRFKVSIASEQVMLQLALSEVRSPAVIKPTAGVTAAGSEEQEEPEEGEIQEPPLAKWVEAAKRHSRLTLLQRRVDVEILDMDRNGILLGRVRLVAPGANANQSRSVAGDLVARGLASVDKYAARRGGREVQELLESQAEAQAEKRGMWVVPNAVPLTPSSSSGQDDDDGDDATSGGVTDEKMFRVDLTEIYDGANFAVNFLAQPDEAGSAVLRGQMKLAELQGMMQAFAREAAAADATSKADAPSTAKGALVAVHHENPTPAEEEGEGDALVWLRGAVEESLPGNSVRVLFVDYGHRAVVSCASLRALPEPLKHYAPQAVMCSLSFLRAESVQSEGGVAAARALNSLAWGKPCLLKVHGKEKQPVTGKSAADGKSSVSGPARLEVSLYAVESFSEEHLARATSVGVKLVRHGFLRISATLARRARGDGPRPRRGRGHSKSPVSGVTSNPVLRELEAAQELAHKEHLRLWAYGHPGDSDDEEAPLLQGEGKKDKEATATAAAAAAAAVKK